MSVDLKSVAEVTYDISALPKVIIETSVAFIPTDRDIIRGFVETVLIPAEHNFSVRRHGDIRHNHVISLQIDQ